MNSNSRRSRLAFRESIWICGESTTRTLRHAMADLKVLCARGEKIFLFKGQNDPDNLNELRRMLYQKDAHVILFWLLPSELAAIRPFLKDRKNFSVVTDDWWIIPHWFMREANYILFRKYHGIAVRLGKLPFVGGSQPPWFLNPYSQTSKYATLCTIMRPLALALSPAAELWSWWRRRSEEISAEKLLYLPFGINNAAEFAPKDEPLEYDFANVSGAFGVWLMRDPHAPFRYSFANLYYDRKHLTDSIGQFKDNPFKFYDCLCEKNYYLPYDAYLQKCRQSRYVLVTGGMHDAALPKYLEFAWLGTPMIGRGVPFEYPWLDDTLIPFDSMRLPATRFKSLLQEALDRYPAVREKSLNWRDRLRKLYDFDTILEMTQAQADGKPIPADYLRAEASGGVFGKK